MKKIGLLAVLVVTFAAMATGSFAESWGPYVDTGVTLDISRTLLGNGNYLWTWTVTNGMDEALKTFSAGLAYDDTPSGLNAGHFFNYFATIPVGTVYELPSQALWVDFNLALGATASFGFETDFQYVTAADHQARDTLLTANWKAKETPSPVIPEASTVMLGLMGLSTLAGFRKLYKR